MTAPPALIVVASLLAAPVALGIFLVYVALRYAPIVGRIFEEVPPMKPQRAASGPGEVVRFPTSGGVELVGTYRSTTAPQRLGVVVFCHEFLSDRHSIALYAEGLREAGFDLFSFDFRNHGESDVEPGMKPLQWVSDRETSDLGAALAYLRTRPDRDPAGFGLFGVSRGAGSSLCVAGSDPSIWAIVTDGAFPTRGTMQAYIEKWAEIYVGSPALWRLMPRSIFAYVGWSGRRFARKHLNRTFPDVERAVKKIGPRPWLAIHGGKDAYIKPKIARDLVSLATGPKEIWVVDGAKHNGAREVQPEAYRARTVSFFLRYAPRKAPPIAPFPIDPRVAALDGLPSRPSRGSTAVLSD